MISATGPNTPPPPTPPPPPGPSTPPPPSGPKRGVIPLDPNSPAGQAAAEALSEVLADIQVAVWQRQATSARSAA